MPAPDMLKTPMPLISKVEGSSRSARSRPEADLRICARHRNRIAMSDQDWFVRLPGRRYQHDEQSAYPRLCPHTTNGIAAFDRLVEQVMSQPPYRHARRVFWIVDNGSAHRGLRCLARLQMRWPNIIVVHTPVHASWLNQVEIYFSIVQRKALTPNDFRSLSELEDRLLAFQEHYAAVAQLFQWRFTRRDLRRLMNKLNTTRQYLPTPLYGTQYVTEFTGQSTKQAFYLLPKIRLVDDFLIRNPRVAGRIREVHPEVSFAL